MLKLILKALLVTFPFSCFCQENKILIYANKNDFLIPYVHDVLKELNSYSGDKGKIFSKVTDLNLLLLNTETDKKFREGLNLYFPNADFKNIEVSDSVLRIFTDNDLFLLVNENILQDKIEFQFTLYSVVKGNIVNPPDHSFPLRNIIKPIAQNDFFIDITSDSYLMLLKNGIKNFSQNQISLLNLNLS